MKTTRLMYALLIVVAMGCNKDEPEPDIDIPTRPISTQDVKVSFPDGAPVNYADYSLYSLAEEAKPDASGNAAVAYNKGSSNIAWLFDKDNNLVMAGFVNDKDKTIDAASTARVMLYYTYAIPMLPEEVQKVFVQDIGSIQGVSDWEDTFTEILKNDRLTLSKGTYLSALEAAIDEMDKTDADPSGKRNAQDRQGTADTDIAAKRPADINVSPGQQKSGLLVSSEVLSKIKFTNHYRRRAHAFFYKTRFKDLNGVQKDILSEINATTASDREERVDPVGAISSLTGVLGAWIEGKSMDFAALESGPFDFQLEDHESEATYKARVVGPGKWRADKKLTNTEQRKLYQLELETVAMDFLIPAFASVISSKIGAKPGANATEAQRESFDAMVDALSTVVEEMIKGIPGVYDDMQKGNYDAATHKVIEALYAGNVGVVKDGFVEVMAILAKNAVAQGFYVSPQYDEVASQKRMMKILEWTDILLQSSDYLRIVYDISKSEFIDEWDLQLMGAKVTLQFVQGHDSLLNTADETKIQAEIKNMNETGGDQHPYFEWSTTGKYGKLVDTKGHSGTEFATADHIVSYQSTTNSNDLGDGDNIDYIYVKASFNNVLIGMDTIAVNVRKIYYELKPEDAVVTGKKHKNAANNVTLYLQKTDGKRDIPNNDIYDFKVEWSTSGNYGSLVGATTTYNDDDIVYKATSEQSGVFYETVTVGIYVKAKGSTDDYTFYGQDKTTIKIDNDPKKKIIWAAMKQFHGHSQQPWTNGNTLHLCVLQNGVTFAQDPDAESYSLQFMDMKTVIGAPIGHSWRAGAPSPYPPHESTDAVGNDGKTYTVIYAWGSRNSYDGSHAEDVYGYLAAVGGARITITLK